MDLEEFTIYKGWYSEIESKNESTFSLSLVEQFAFSKYYKNFIKPGKSKDLIDSSLTTVIANDKPILSFIDELAAQNIKIFAYFGTDDNTNHADECSEEDKECTTMSKLQEKNVTTHKIEMSSQCIVFDYPKRIAEFIIEDITSQQANFERES